MTRFLIASLVLLGGCPGMLLAQPGDEASPAQEAASRKTRELLAERVSTRQLTKEMPLAKLLESLENLLPEGKKIGLRIDKEAFGKDFAKVAATPIRLAVLENVSLSTVLRLARTQIPTKTDYRFGPQEFVITTPARAFYTASYDVSDLIEKPEDLPTMRINARAPFSASNVRASDPVQKAAAVVRLIVATIDSDSWQQNADPRGTIQVVNGRVVVRTNAERHAEISELLDALRRLGDVETSIRTDLFEVDQAFYTKLRGTRRATRADMEKQEQNPPPAPPPEAETLGKLLLKQKRVLTSEGVKIGNGSEGLILSRYNAVCIPALIGPKDLRPALEGIAFLTQPQTVLEGVSFQAAVAVSADRRFVHLKISEKTTEVEQLPKLEGLPAVRVPKAGEQVPDVQEQVADLLQALRMTGPLEPVLSETVHTDETVIPDGGSRMIPVRVRPRALQAADRWWVLVISPRIVIQAEEREILRLGLVSRLPALLADLLTNPRLKTTRAFYGSPDDTRFALLASVAWAWPKDFQPAVPERQLTPAGRKGKRLLGIRIDEFKWGKDDSDLTVRVTLLNAGGDDNGAVPGGCTLHYVARRKDKDPVVVELLDSAP